MEDHVGWLRDMYLSQSNIIKEGSNIDGAGFTLKFVRLEIMDLGKIFFATTELFSYIFSLVEQLLNIKGIKTFRDVSPISVMGLI